jgi:type VI secretion system protein ImpG
MLEELLPYYEKELSYLRDLSGEFAQRYPKIAQRLSMEGDQCEDPHVERLIEAFAFLTARVHRRLDDEYPEYSPYSIYHSFIHGNGPCKTSINWPLQNCTAPASNHARN